MAIFNQTVEFCIDAAQDVFLKYSDTLGNNENKMVNLPDGGSISGESFPGTLNAPPGCSAFDVFISASRTGLNINGDILSTGTCSGYSSPTNMQSFSVVLGPTPNTCP